MPKSDPSDIIKRATRLLNRSLAVVLGGFAAYFAIAHLPALLQHNLESLRVARLLAAPASGLLLEANSGQFQNNLWLGLLHASDKDCAAALQTAALAPENRLKRIVSAKIAFTCDEIQQAAEELKSNGAWNELLESAKIAYQNNKIDDAYILFLAANQIEPEQAVDRLAEILFYKKQPEQALSLLQQAITKFPNSKIKITWLMQKGDYLTIQKDFQNALLAYHGAVEAAPDNKNAWFSLARGYQRLANLEKASETAVQALQLPGPNHLLFEFLGDIEVVKKLWSSAAAYYRQAHEDEPNLPHYWIKDANARLNLNDCPAAGTLFDEAQNRKPAYLKPNQWANYQLQVARCFQKNGQLEQAKLRAKMAVLSAPGDADIQKQADSIR